MSLADRIRRTLGSDLLEEGVIHVAAVWEASPQHWVTIRIGTGSPRSSTDRFILELARARANVIVTTGKILRDEPQLTHSVNRPELLKWRRDCLGKKTLPQSVILTSGRGLNFGHPLFRSRPRPLVVTSRDGERNVGPEASAMGVEVVARERPGLRDTIAHLTADRGLATISVEAGPSSSHALYEEPLALDELMLSVYQAPHLPNHVRGLDFVTPARVRASLPVASSPCRSQEESGLWAFMRFRRQPE